MSLLKVFLTILAAGLVLGSVYVITLFGPRAANDINDADISSISESMEALAKSERLEKEFCDKLQIGDPTDDDLKKLEESILLLQAFIEKSRTTDRDTHIRLEKLRSTLQNIRGKRDAEEIASLARAADNAFTSQNTNLALELYQKLRDAQSHINMLYPDSEYHDIRMLAKAEQMLRLVSAAPLAAQIEDLQKQIDTMIAQKHWNEAQKLIEKAIEIQNVINKDYANTSHANFSKIREYEIELDSLKAAPLESEVNDAIKRGKEFEKLQKYIEAAEEYKTAADKQKEMNLLFEKSRYASDEKLREIVVLKDTAMSRNLFEDISKQRTLLITYLQSGTNNHQVTQIVQSMLVKCERLKNEFPSSALIDEDIILSLRFLSYLGSSISEIYSLTIPQLLPLNSKGNLKMLKTEVPQKLYTLVMQENPSRNANPDNPVETISWENAADFCRRLSWVLARKVSLPTREQIVNAVGSLKYADLNAISWNAGNSGLRTREVATSRPNTKGFYDLLGNVAEYTAEDMSTAGIAGGSAQTWSDSISEIPFTEIETNQRGDRMIGFRFIVDFSSDK